MKKFFIMTLCILLTGCAKFQYSPEPIDTSNILNDINTWSIYDQGLNAYLESNGIPPGNLNGSTFTLSRLYLTGLYYSPEMQLAFKKYKKARIIFEHSDYRINPEFSIPFEHHSETPDGISRWTIGAVLSFIYERKGKREARVAEAEVQLFNAELAMNKIAFELYKDIQMQFHNYCISVLRVNDLENEIKTLNDLSDQLQKSYDLGGVSQFEISTVKLELQQRLFELSLQKNKMQEYRDNLLSLTNLAASNYENIEIDIIDPVTYTKELYSGSELLNTDIVTLQSQLMSRHLDMALQLNAYAQAEAKLRLEIEKQYPDIVLSPGFIFDQSDKIWTLGASWIIPVFENSSQNLEILKALEDRKISQQEIITLQKKLLDTLYQMQQSMLRHHNTIRESDQIIDSIEERAKIIEKQVELGGVDRLAILRNRIEYYKAKQAQSDIYHGAINSMIDLQNLLQLTPGNLRIEQVVASWLDKHEEKLRNE